MPKIGMRMVKSAVAVFFCFVVYLIRGQGTPFYSAIAAVLCIQPYLFHSLETGKNRIAATLIGGVFGVLFLFLERHGFLLQSELLRYACVSLMIIPILYVTVWMKKPGYSYLACVVFMSISVSHATDANPYLFAFNRVTDTLIGIFIAFFVNACHMPQKRRKDCLYAVSLEGALCGLDGVMDSFTKIRLNQLLDRGVQVAFATAEIPAVFLNTFQGVNIRLPVIAMRGAVLYDSIQQKYEIQASLEPETIQSVLEVLKEMEMNHFLYEVENDTMYIYHGYFCNQEEERYYHATKNLPYKNYVFCENPIDNKGAFICLSCLDTKKKIEQAIEQIKRLHCFFALRLECTEAEDPAYTLLEVYAKKAAFSLAVETLCKRADCKDAVLIAGTVNDLYMFDSDFPICVLSDSAEKMKERGDMVIGARSKDGAVRAIGTV